MTTNGSTCPCFGFLCTHLCDVSTTWTCQAYDCVTSALPTGGDSGMRVHRASRDVPMKSGTCRHLRTMCRCHRHIVVPSAVDMRLADSLEGIGYGW